MGLRRSVNRVRVGLYVDPVAPLRVVRAGIALSRLMGADDVWFGDHTRAMLPASVWDPATNPMARVVRNLDAYFDPTVIIGRYAGAHGMRMGTSVTDPIRRNPADLARAWSTLHHVTNGKAILGIGSGEAENTVPYGLPIDRKVSRLEDTLAAVRAAWATPDLPVTHAGDYHSWNHASFAVPELRGTRPPIWVAAQGPRASRIAGRYGDGWIHMHEGFDAWQASGNAVAEGARAAGRAAESLTRSLLIAGVLVTDDDALEAAMAAPVMRAALLALPAQSWTMAGVEHPLGAGYGGPSDYDPALLTPAVLAEAARVLTPDAFRALMPCGNSAQVAGYLTRFVEAGVNHVIIINLAPACGARLAIQAQREQFALVRRLKGMRPGRFDPPS